MLSRLFKSRYEVTEIIDFEDVYRIVQTEQPEVVEKTCISLGKEEKRIRLKRFKKVPGGFEVLWDPDNYDIRKLVIAKKIK